MVYVLLVLIVFILKQKFRTIKSLFRSDEDSKKFLSQAYFKADDKFGKENGRTVILGFTFILIVFFTLVYLLFYILSMIYVGGLWFTLVSVLQICFTFKDFYGNICELAKYVDDPDYFKKDNKIQTILNVFFDFAYIGYLLYFIIINWR